MKYIIGNYGFGNDADFVIFLKKEKDKGGIINSPELIRDYLRAFEITDNPQIWNLLSFVFADNMVQDAVPLLIEKIKSVSAFGYNGTLLYSLSQLNCLEYFHDFVEFICSMDFEAQYESSLIVIKYSKEVESKDKLLALQKLKAKKIIMESNAIFDSQSEHQLEIICHVEDILNDL